MGFRPPPPRCQCDPKCKNKPLPKQAFCKVHQRRCDRKAPPSGYESSYQPLEYNQHLGRMFANNCYGYATGFDELPKDCTKDKCDAPFPQLGLSSGHPSWENIQGKRCPDVMARALGDIPGSYIARFTQKCKAGTRKIAFVVDPNRDYHVLRQDKVRVHPLMPDSPPTAYWSDKSGTTKVKDVDSSKRPIYDPSLARFYTEDGVLQYTYPCGYMCIPAKKPKLTRGSSRKRIQKTRKRRTHR